MDQQTYSISDLASFSGIKPHTIRVWEQRYELLSPIRTETNIRRYTDDDLKKLLNVAALNRLGYKISRIARMPDDEIRQLLNSKVTDPNPEQHVLNILKISMLNFDEELFISGVNSYLEQHSFEEVLSKVLSPFMVQIGVLWQTSAICPAHEHFISNLVRQLFSEKIANQNLANAKESTVFVMFLPQGELHELTLLLTHYFIRSQGYKSIYLGQSVPIEDLDQLVARFETCHFVTLSPGESAKQYLALYLKMFNDRPEYNDHRLTMIVPQTEDDTFGKFDRVATVSDYRSVLGQI